jgi:magnesium transporter
MLHRHKSRRETSADHIGPHAVLAYPSDTAEIVLARIRQLRRTTWDLVCVIDRNERLLGTLTAAELLALPGTAELDAVARRDHVRVLPGTDQEKMASIALHHGVAALPVVDETGPAS